MVLGTVLGQLMGTGARRHHRFIQALLDLAAKTARVIRPDGRMRRNPARRRRSRRPAARAPRRQGAGRWVVLESCRSSIDESMISGEPVPVKRPGEGTGGTISGTGSLIIKPGGSVPTRCCHQIVDMVANAQRSRASIQKLADSVAGIFVPVVVGVAILAFSLVRLGSVAPLAYAPGVGGGGAGSSPAYARWATRCRS